MPMRSWMFPVATAVLVVVVILGLFQLKRFQRLKRRGRPASPDFLIILGALAVASAYIAFVTKP